MHRHRAKHTHEENWHYPAVPNHPREREASGNITRIETCSCGADRRVDINGRWRVAGEWADGLDEHAEVRRQ